MPKYLKNDELAQYLLQFGDTFKVIEANQVFCNNCQKNLIFLTTSNINRHIKSSSHQDPTVNISKSHQLQYRNDLCEALVAANIPINKVSHPRFREFLEKYTGHVTPHESTLRQSYYTKTTSSTLNKIKPDLKNKYIWLSVDETLDMRGRSLLSVVVGAFENNCKSYLIGVKFKKSMVAADICEFVKSCLEQVFSEDDIADNEKVLLFITNSTAEMLQVGELLKETYHLILHIICLVHVLLRIADFARHNLPNIHKFIENFKKIFTKAPCRHTYKQICPALPLPPDPVNAGWLEACFFYVKHYEKIKQFLDSLTEEERTSITECKIIINKDDFKENLDFIYNNFQETWVIIAVLQKQDFNLKKNLDLVLQVTTKLKALEGRFGEKLSEHIESVIKGSPDLDVTSKIVNGENDEERYKLHEDLFVFAPAMRCDVERTFVRFKEILRQNRSYLLETNLEQHLVFNVNRNS